MANPTRTALFDLATATVQRCLFARSAKARAEYKQFEAKQKKQAMEDVKRGKFRKMSAYIYSDHSEVTVRIRLSRKFKRPTSDVGFSRDQIKNIARQVAAHIALGAKPSTLEVMVEKLIDREIRDRARLCKLVRNS